MAEQTGRAADPERHGVLHSLQKHGPNSRQMLGFVTLIASGATILVLGGIALAGVVIVLMLATPVLVVASPVLIPVGFVLFIGSAGFLSVGAAIAATITAVKWIYNYFKGQHPPGSEHVNYVGRRIADMAYQTRDLAREYGANIQAKSQEAAPGA
eukprot:c22204_g1_i1 orf=278-742(+)